MPLDLPKPVAEYFAADPPATRGTKGSGHAVAARLRESGTHPVIHGGRRSHGDRYGGQRRVGQARSRCSLRRRLSASHDAAGYSTCRPPASSRASTPYVLRSAVADKEAVPPVVEATIALPRVYVNANAVVRFEVVKVRRFSGKERHRDADCFRGSRLS